MIVCLDIWGETFPVFGNSIESHLTLGKAFEYIKAYRD